MYTEGKYRWYPYGHNEPDQGIYYVYMYNGHWTTNVDVLGTSKQVPACRVRIDWLPGAFIKV